MKKIKISLKQSRNISKYFRALIQLLFFIFLPQAFSTGFSAVKTIAENIGSNYSIEWSSFICTFCAITFYTIIFGRFFCGFACSFGALGDFVRFIYVTICKKMKKKPITLSNKITYKLSYLKYFVLLLVLILCFFDVWTDVNGFSPWDTFSQLRKFHFNSRYIGGLILLILIVFGAALSERFFCRCLCPFGAIFSILPVIPLFNIERKRKLCAKGCKACSNICPSNIEPGEVGDWRQAGDCFQCQKCINICPKKNAHGFIYYLRGNEIWLTALKAAVLAIVLVLAGK